MLTGDVIIHYPGDCKHGYTGTITACRTVGKVREYTVRLDGLLKVSGLRPIREVYVFERHLRPYTRLVKVPQPEPAKAPANYTNVKAPTNPRGVPITPHDLARRLNVNPETVRHWIKRGELPAHRMGRHWMIYESDAARMTAAREALITT